MKKVDIIHIAVDRHNKRYIAYSLKTSFFGIGICVPSAVEDYNKKSEKFKEKNRDAEVMENAMVQIGKVLQS